MRRTYRYYDARGYRKPRRIDAAEFRSADERARLLEDAKRIVTRALAMGRATRQAAIEPGNDPARPIARTEGEA